MNHKARFLALVSTLSAGLLGGALGPAPNALAQYAEEGVLNAVSYHPLPAGQPLAVRPLDNSDENLEILAEFERVLREQGYTIHPESPLVLTFDTEDRIGAWSDDGRRTVLELEGSGGVIGRDSARARFNIFDSQRGGIVNEGEGGNGVVTPSQYRLNVAIEEKGGGERLWQGWATADLQQNSGTALVKAMVPALVRSLGETIKSQPFEMY